MVLWWRARRLYCAVRSRFHSLNSYSRFLCDATPLRTWLRKTERTSYAARGGPALQLTFLPAPKDRAQIKRRRASRESRIRPGGGLRPSPSPARTPTPGPLTARHPRTPRPNMQHAPTNNRHATRTRTKNAWPIHTWATRHPSTPASVQNICEMKSPMATIMATTMATQAKSPQGPPAAPS